MLYNLFQFHNPSSPYNERLESLEPILQLVAQDHCSPWKKCDLFAPKSDFRANKNFEIQTLISDEKSGQSI